ncbi:hypothetical protein D9619_009682 [Psilocybe cf. subviscida]|uniref:(2E,6E)-farnesyl diphosphate synthase n=1 Tax=Psilocybe cf. subviscida TaxID=2480587 RepID=A0A8H5F706_9AGAR|nr:hypothetical protein D9619_009682 [Psilocybe cf. subviscida]
MTQPPQLQQGLTMSLYDNILDVLSHPPEWSPDNEQAILEPFKYITSNPGKEIRGKMIEAFNLWLDVPKEKLRLITKVVDMLHAASLMIDDIEDDSQLRRGMPVTHKIYGIPQTINTANYVYFLAYKELFALRNGETTPPRRSLDAVVTEELLSLHRGQGLEILWRDSLQCPTEEEYIRMVNNKTGGLLRIGIKLMMACSTENTDIRDDLMNLQSTEYTSNKGFAEDLSEGKFSFPVVHGIHADRANRQILNVLQKRPTTPTLKIHTISYLRDKTKSFEYTMLVLKNLEGQTRAEIARLGGNKGLEAIMDLLHVSES